MVKVGENNELRESGFRVDKLIKISNDGKQFILRLPTKITNCFDWELRKGKKGNKIEARVVYDDKEKNIIKIYVDKNG